MDIHAGTWLDRLEWCSEVRALSIGPFAKGSSSASRPFRPPDKALWAASGASAPWAGTGRFQLRSSRPEPAG